MEATDLRTINGVYVGDTQYSKIYLGDKQIYPNIEYIDDGVEFDDISIKPLLITNSMVTATEYQIDGNDYITSHDNIINAIDIDWGGANIGTIKNIKTTGDLLKIVDEIRQGIIDCGGEIYDWENSDIVYVTESLSDLPSNLHPRYVYVTGSINDNYVYPSSQYYFGRTNSDGILQWDIEEASGTVTDINYVNMTAMTRMYKWNTSTQQYDRWIPMQYDIHSELRAQYIVKWRVNDKQFSHISSGQYHEKFAPLFTTAGRTYECYVEYVGPDGVTYKTDFNIVTYRSITP